MAAATETPKKARKAQGPRVERPTYAIFSYTDENGNPVALDPTRLTGVFTKDPAVLAKWATEGKLTGACFKELKITDAKRASPAVAEAPAAE